MSGHGGPYYGTPAHTPRTGTVDNVPHEALRIVLALAAREIGNRGPARCRKEIHVRALDQVQAAYDGGDA
jgi:hypothetical protein